MNELGMWIKQNTTRKEFAALIKTSELSVAQMCGRYGVPENHAEMVSQITGIPMARLRGVAIKRGEQSVKLAFNGAHWTGNECGECGAFHAPGKNTMCDR